VKLNLSKYDRICFLGDSITANGQWIKEISQWFIDNMPQLEIGLYNCGLSGARGREMNVKNRFVTDCLKYFPKYVVIMYGMNDVEVYSHGSDDEESKANVEWGMSHYADALKYYVEECKKFGATPIICSPTPYNEYGNTPVKSYEGTDKDLEILACQAQEIAKENNLLFIDMRSALLKYMDQNPINEDRMHPNDYGHHLMAETFLCAIGAKDIVEPDKECKISPKNEERYTIEQTLRRVMYVERLWQHEDFERPLAERKELAVQYSKKQNMEFWDNMVENYNKNADFKDELRGEIIKLTREMYI